MKTPLPRYDETPPDAPPTGDPSPKDNPPAKDPATSAVKKDETFELGKGENKKLVTLNEMQNLAEEAHGAQKAFRDGAESKKEGEQGIRVMQLLSILDDPETRTDADIKELAAIMNIDAEEFMEKMDDTPPSDEDTEGAEGRVNAKDLKEAMAELLGMSVEDAKGIMGMSRADQISSARGNIKAAVKEAVDKDEVFDKLVGKGDKKDDRFEIITDDVLEGVLQRISQGEPFGADVIQSETQKVRAKYTKFGIPNTQDLHPNLGQLSGALNLPEDVLGEELIKRIPANEDESGDNFAKRWMQKALMASRNSG